MIANDPNNDEYKLDDLDLLASEPEDRLQPEEPLTADVASTSNEIKPFWENPNIRKGLIVIGVIVGLLVCYGLISALFSNNQDDEITPVTTSQKQTTVVPQSAVAVTTRFSSEQTDTDTSKKLNNIQQAQSNVESNIQAMNTQINNMNASLNEVATKMATLNASMLALNEKIDAQMREMQQMAMKKRPAPTRKRPPQGMGMRGMPPMAYYIQAVIPGRAWLMSSNGSTLTVREGTVIPGYGVVKLIDPEQGKVMTSSGRTIRFSQVDS